MSMTGARGDLVHEILGITRSESYREGVYRLTISGGKSITVSLGAAQVSLIRQLHRLLWRVVHENWEHMLDLAGTDGREKLLALAWNALEPARFLGGSEGDYEVKLPGGPAVGYSLNEEDERLLKAYDRLLSRIYSQNSAILDSTLGLLSTTPVAA